MGLKLIDVNFEKLEGISKAAHLGLLFVVDFLGEDLKFRNCTPVCLALVLNKCIFVEQSNAVTLDKVALETINS